MPKDKKEPATQTTDKGLAIPVPSRDEFIRNIAKVAPKPDPSRDAEAGPTPDGD